MKTLKPFDTNLPKCILEELTEKQLKEILLLPKKIKLIGGVFYPHGVVSQGYEVVKSSIPVHGYKVKHAFKKGKLTKFLYEKDGGLDIGYLFDNGEIVTF